jgi:hypothetical protein
MKNKVQGFIDLWKEKRSLKTLMGSDITASDVEELRSELAKMEPAQRKEAEEILRDVSSVLIKRIKTLKEKREQIYGEMQRSKKTTSACLAYQKQGQHSPGHKEEMAEHTAHKITKIQEREERLRENLRVTEKSTKE